MTERRDKIGRRIGRNWWRELVVQTWRDAYDAWWLLAEDATMLYSTELAEYKIEHPTPTLRATMIGLSS